MPRMVCGRVTHCNGTQGMRVRMVCVECGHADSWEWYPRNFELVVNECKLCWFPYKKKSVLVPVYYIY